MKSHFSGFLLLSIALEMIFSWKLGSQTTWRKVLAGLAQPPGRCTSRMALSSSRQTMPPVRVRFAPSPTGSLHVGGARTALFNWLLARKTNGTFILRIEDTDEARSTKVSEESILRDLTWLNLNWDEGPGVEGPHSPYRQSERKEIYRRAAEQLIAQGDAYRCFSTEDELETEPTSESTADTGDHTRTTHFRSVWRDAKPEDIQARLDRGDPYAVRFKVPAGKVVTIVDKVRGVVTWETDAALLGDFVIMRSNGMPVYNFCVSVDDADMRITHVIRAEEHLSNTLRQMLILEALRVKPPTYAHCSLILGSDRSKLSKRHGATSVTQFSQQGFVPEAMINYLANLGWNDGTDKEIYTAKELCEAFSLERIVKGAAVFDMDKLRWVNAQHLRLRSSEQMRPIVLRELCSGADGEAILPPTAAATASVTGDHAAAAGTGAGSAEQLSGTSQHPDFEGFLALATKIAQRDMEVTTDTRRLVSSCLEYNLQRTLTTDPHAAEILSAEGFPKVLKELVNDYASHALPRGEEGNFPTLWKEYMKALSKSLGLKGKDLFHPVRLCLTGRVSGPDVGDQLQMLALSKCLLHPAYDKRVGLEERMAQLEQMYTNKAFIKAQQ